MEAIVRQFEIKGVVAAIEPFGSGHINDTYRVKMAPPRGEAPYLLQRINEGVFKDPAAVMENIDRVTRHLRGKWLERGVEDVARRVPGVYRTTGGELVFRQAGGGWWRMMDFIEGMVVHESVERPEQARLVGYAFGEFAAMLSDLPGPRLHDSIPDFHNTAMRLAQFQEALEADVKNRAGEARGEIDFLVAREPLARALAELKLTGAAPERIAHNDTKLNNILLDAHGGECYAVIDLDTVMGGLALDDFGDMVRTTTSRSAEDERDLAKVRMEMELFEALSAGYLAGAGSMLKAGEIEHLVTGGKVIVYEQALRFLADYLAGDRYYKVHRAAHNLDRARTQIKLLASIETQEEAMRECIANLADSNLKKRD